MGALPGRDQVSTRLRELASLAATVADTMPHEVAAAAALVALDRVLTGSEQHPPLGHAWVQAAVLVLLLLSAAVRAPVRGEDVVPQLATSALVGCLVLIAGQAAAAWPAAQQRLRPCCPKPRATSPARSSCRTWCRRW